jgi:hypothetical protein
MAKRSVRVRETLRSPQFIASFSNWALGIEPTSRGETGSLTS